jgi:hypothetical protein
MKFIGFTVVLWCCFACGNKSANSVIEGNTPEEMKVFLKSMDDSLTTEFKSAMSSNEMVSEVRVMKTIQAYTRFYLKYPKDKYAPFCMDKVQGLYLQINNLRQSVIVSDSLIQKYPEYENRFAILESQGSNYDVFEEIRDTAKVRKYFTLFLKENKGVDAEKRKDIMFRLNHLDLTFDELILLRSKEALSK